ncbi:MAG TPA: hypothetical protein VK285_04565 [Gaiellaceae bacterium]|nr:hypothetical protein [Gaiellaceae bacterium]
MEGDQGVRELPLDADDLLSVLLQSGGRTTAAEVLTLMQKPPKNILEGLYWERVPTRGRGGRRG